MPLADATGRLAQLLPDGTPSDEREQLLMLVRKGIEFSRPQGRPPGVLRRHIEATVAATRPRNFHCLLAVLRLEAQQTAVGLGPGVIISVDRGAEKLTYRDGERVKTVSLKRVQNVAGLRG